MTLQRCSGWLEDLLSWAFQFQICQHWSLLLSAMWPAAVPLRWGAVDLLNTTGGRCIWWRVVNYDRFTGICCHLTRSPESIDCCRGCSCAWKLNVHRCADVESVTAWSDLNTIAIKYVFRMEDFTIHTRGLWEVFRSGEAYKVKYYCCCCCWTSAIANNWEKRSETEWTFFHLFWVWSMRVFSFGFVEDDCI